MRNPVFAMYRHSQLHYHHVNNCLSCGIATSVRGVGSFVADHTVDDGWMWHSPSLSTSRNTKAKAKAGIQLTVLRITAAWMCQMCSQLEVCGAGVSVIGKRYIMILVWDTGNNAKTLSLIDFSATTGRSTHTNRLAICFCWHTW